MSWGIIPRIIEDLSNITNDPDVMIFFALDKIMRSSSLARTSIFNEGGIPPLLTHINVEEARRVLKRICDESVSNKDFILSHATQQFLSLTSSINLNVCEIIFLSLNTISSRMIGFNFESRFCNCSSNIFFILISVSGWS